MNKASFWSFTQKYDFFSQPFSFMMGQKVKRSTIFGGLLSLTIIIISVSYFGYLMYNFFGYKIYPNVSNSIQVNEAIDLQLDYDFQMFSVLINGQSVEDYEKQMNKKYLIYKLFYEEYSDTTQNLTEIKLSNCDHEDFTMFKCVDKETELQKLYLNSKTRKNGVFNILIGKCINEIGVQENCAPEEEIDELFTDIHNSVQFYVKIKQYNTLTRQFEVGFKSEYITFDSKQILNPNLVMKKATSQVTEGLIIQETAKIDSVFEYRRYDSSFDKESLTFFNTPSFKLSLIICYSVDQISNYVIVQHIQITQVLAQFMSIFNSLLLFGVFARKFANKNIQSDIISILLADQYKEEAFNIISQKKQKDKEKLQSFQINQQQQNISLDNQKFNKSKANLKKKENNILQNKINQYSISKKQTNQKNNLSDNSTSLMNQQQKQNFDSIDLKYHQQKKKQQQKKDLLNQEVQQQTKVKEDQFENICKKHEVIQSEDLNIAISQIMNKSTFQKIKQKFLKLFSNQKINSNEDDPNNNFKQILQNVEEEMKNSLNIYSIYKELIYLKRAIKLILTDDQYAALHYCTTLIPLDPQINQNKIQGINKKIELQKVITPNIEQNSPLQSINYQINQDILLNNKQSIDLNQNKYKSYSFQYGHQTNINNSYYHNNIQNEDNKLDDRSLTIPRLNSFGPEHNNQKKFIQHCGIKDKSQICQDQSILFDEKLQYNIMGDNQGVILNESVSEESITKDLDNKDENTRNNMQQLQKYKKSENDLRIQLQNKDIQENHLVNMDIIDKNKEIRIKYLHQFIMRTSLLNIHNIGSIDANILNSLFK